jgi:glycosyltransferase involved in cell wall biosynthesis
MKILLVITGLSLGGAEKVVTSLADALCDLGHEVHLAYMTGASVVLPKNKSIKVVSLGMVSSKGVLSGFLRLRRLIIDFQPDIVHSHMVHANILTRLVRLVTPMVRLISTAHSSCEGGKLRMLAYRLTDALADLSTNVSSEAVVSFVKARAVKSGRMIAVHNGISCDEFIFNPVARVRLRKQLCIDEGWQLILAVGRLQEVKDYPNLLRALAQLQLDGINYQLCIAGDGPIKGSLEELAVQLGLFNRVRFLGNRCDVADLMSAADVFVLSSAWEGFGLVVAEAMACERVVVATDCGGVREVLGEAGYLVKPKDANYLAQALRTALQLSPAQSAAIGYAARQRVLDLYARDAVVEKWLRLYVSNPR